MTETRKLRVFLCHASQDKPIVRELYQRLNAEGWIDPWLDEEKLLPGQDWDMEIEKAVEDADVVIVCLSNNSITKEGYVQREFKFVLDIALEKPEGTIFIIPLRLNDCQPPRRLRSWQYVDYFPESRRKWAYDRLLESLKLRAKNSEVQTELLKGRQQPSYQVPENEQKVLKKRVDDQIRKPFAELILLNVNPFINWYGSLIAFMILLIFLAWILTSIRLIGFYGISFLGPIVGYFLAVWQSKIMFTRVKNGKRWFWTGFLSSLLVFIATFTDSAGLTSELSTLFVWFWLPLHLIGGPLYMKMKTDK